MTVGGLLEVLRTYPRGREVVLPGANHFRPLHEISNHLYCPRTGEIWERDEIAEIEERREPYQHVVVLWP